MKRILLILLLVGLTSCKKEEEPTFPPEIVGATVTCGESSTEDSPVVEELGVEITDQDRDLLPATLQVTVNGVRVEGMTDDDADDVYTWSPPTSWNPPLVCRGIFQFIVQVRDAEGHQVKQTLEVDKSS